MFLSQHQAHILPADYYEILTKYVLNSAQNNRLQCIFDAENLL